MMAKDPAQRYQTPLAVAEALADWTQVPIPAPPDNEMPQLSLAAMGAAPGEQNVTGARNPTAGEPSPAPTNRKQWQVANQANASSVPILAAAPSAPVTNRAAAPVPTVTPKAPAAPVARPGVNGEPRPAAGAPVRPSAAGAGRAVPPVVVPKKPAAPPTVTPKPKAESAPARWKKPAPATEAVAGRGDTPPNTARSKTTAGRSRENIPSVQKARRLLWWLVGGGSVLAVGLGLLIWRLLR
jgi:hypothetical protein